MRWTTKGGGGALLQRMKNLRQISIRQQSSPSPPLDFRLFFRQKMKKQANKNKTLNKKKVEKTQKTGNNDEAAGHLAVLDIPSLFCKTAETSNDQCKTIRKNSKSCAPTPTKPPEMPIYQSTEKLAQWRISCGDRIHIAVSNSFFFPSNSLVHQMLSFLIGSLIEISQLIAVKDRFDSSKWTKNGSGKII